MNNALTLVSNRSAALFVKFDALTQLVRTRVYNGANPAIASVYGPYRASIIVMLIISFIILVFGSIVPIDSAAVAKANVVVLSSRKTIQHLEGGIIQKILVKDGDLVKPGQALVELSDVTPKANRTILQTQLYSEQISEQRLLALREGKSQLTLNEDVKRVQNEPDVSKMIKEQTALFLSQKQTYDDKTKTLRLRVEQTKEEIGGLRSQIKSTSGQLRYINEEISTVSKLVKKGLAIKPRLLALQREQERLAGDRGQYTANVAKAQQSINGIEVELLNLKNDFNTQLASEMKENQQKRADLQEKLRAASDVMTRTIITSPTEGIITGLKFHTEGGVITPGTPIMDIIPQDEELVLEAKINPIDIDVVTAGLEARVVFSAYKTRNLPQLTGKVTQVSADSFTQQGLQETSYYTAKIAVDSEQMKEMAPQIRLHPGMPADVYIHTGSRSFLGYLFAPITDSLRKAFKES